MGAAQGTGTGKGAASSMKKTTLAAVIAAVCIIILASAGMWGYYRYSMSLISRNAGSMREYGRHYLFVCDDDSEMWQSIYDYALASAEESDAVLEWVGESAPINYSLAECMEIGISSKADGIILAPDGTSEIRDAISRSDAEGIPVVCLMRDSSDSGRISFVGASNYQMGELYGEQILRLLKEGGNRVCLLTDSANSQAASNLLYSQIVSAVKNGLPEGCSADIYTKEVDSRSDFEAEEMIRGILMDGQTPDILICVNSVQTECAEAAIVDYNLVDEVQVIGYYASAGILSALRRDLLPLTITCDAKQVGELSVGALNEYLDTGHVSDYLDITLEAVTSENVNRYVRSQHLAYTGGEGT